MPLKLLNQLIDDTRFVELFAEQVNGGGIGNGSHHSEGDKLLKRAPVVDLEFQIFIAEVEQFLQYQQLEVDERINPLSAGIALAIMAATLLQQWPECTRPRQGRQRWLLLLKRWSGKKQPSFRTMESIH